MTNETNGTNQNLIKTNIAKLLFSIPDSNVTVPKVVQIQEAVLKYKYLNGEATTEISKIALSLADQRFIEIAKAQNYQENLAPTFYGEINDPQLINQLSPQLDALIGKQLSTSAAKIALRWVSFGSSGGWNGLKLVFTRQAFATK